MTVVTYGTNTWPVRIGDNVTAGQGTYEIYLRPTSRNKVQQFLSIDGVDYVFDGGKLIMAMAGKKKDVYNFRGHKHAGSNTDYQNLIKALGYWADNNTLLYLTSKDTAGNNRAVYAAYSTQAITQWQGRITSCQERDDEANGDNILMDFVFVRLTA